MHFGKDGVYDINDSQRTKSTPCFFDKKRVTKPSIGDYVLTRKLVRMISENCAIITRLDHPIAIHYNNLLMILAVMEQNISDKKMEDWEGKSIALQQLNKIN